MTQAFSRDGDGANPKPPPAYYAHAAFVACDALYARGRRRAPKAFVSAAIRSGALAWPSSFARTETSERAVPGDVRGRRFARRRGVHAVPRHVGPSAPQHRGHVQARVAHGVPRGARAGAGGLELEGGGPRQKRNGSRVAVAARGAGEETSAFRLVRVFLDDDDALWDFMECVLKAAEMEQEEEEEEEERRRRRRRRKKKKKKRGQTSAFEASRKRLGWTCRDGPTPSAVFLALLELLAWDVDTLEATLREDAAATVLGYIGLARQFAHEWPARDAEKLLRFCEAFASKLDAKAALTRKTKTRRGSSAEALGPEGSATRWRRSRWTRSAPRSPPRANGSRGSGMASRVRGFYNPYL